MAKSKFPDKALNITTTGLCDKCKPYGECRMGLGYPDLEFFWAAKKRSKYQINGNLLLANDTQFSSYALDKIRFYMLSVPTDIPKHRNRNNPRAHHLQTGLNAFHDEDYETALLHFEAYREVEDDNNVLANYGLAMIHFKLKNYEKASYFYSISKSNRKDFDELCIAGLEIEQNLMSQEKQRQLKNVAQEVTEVSTEVKMPGLLLK